MNFNSNEYNGFYRRPDDQAHRSPDPVEAAGFRVEDADPAPGGHAPHYGKRRKSGGGKIVALALVCALLGGAAGGLGVAGATGALKSSSTTLYEGSRPLSVVNTAEINTGETLTPQQIYDTNLAACVGINAGVTTNVWGFETTSAVSGSGFVISQDGYIVTNYHVVENASTIKVTFSDGKSYDAVYVGGERDNDVAVLKIDASGLTPVVLGDSDNMLVGDSVYTIGNPLGELTYTMTDGMVSALNRTVTNQSGITMNMLQTNCTINSGNSGGPLFNQYGEVIGITSAKLSNSASSSSASIEGIGFAIPWNDVKDLVKQLIETGYVVKPYLGVTVSTISEAESKRYNIPEGAYIESLSQGGAAEQAGLQVGDIITAVDDTAITTHTQLIAVKDDYDAGDTAVFTVVRRGETLKVDVTFGEAPRVAEGDSTQQSSGSGFTFPFGWGN